MGVLVVENVWNPNLVLRFYHLPVHANGESVGREMKEPENEVGGIHDVRGITFGTILVTNPEAIMSENRSDRGMKTQKWKDSYCNVCTSLMANLLMWRFTYRIPSQKEWKEKVSGAPKKLATAFYSRVCDFVCYDQRRRQTNVIANSSTKPRGASRTQHRQT